MFPHCLVVFPIVASFLILQIPLVFVVLVLVFLAVIIPWCFHCSHCVPVVLFFMVVVHVILDAIVAAASICVMVSFIILVLCCQCFLFQEAGWVVVRC